MKENMVAKNTNPTTVRGSAFVLATKSTSAKQKHAAAAILGRSGGAQATPKQKAAARKNGKSGGRPPVYRLLKRHGHVVMREPGGGWAQLVPGDAHYAAAVRSLKQRGLL